MFDTTMTLPEMPLVQGIQHADFEVWCKCVRRLLGWSKGTMEDWEDLYASGHTPRDAARHVVYGDGQGD